jgi:hypothetical protein
MAQRLYFKINNDAEVHDTMINLELHLCLIEITALGPSLYLTKVLYSHEANIIYWYPSILSGVLFDLIPPRTFLIEQTRSRFAKYLLIWIKIGITNL